ncbi:MAG: site-specific DNA-methyltransferase [Nitrobacter sp.]|uniref:site-specific DNA-methyltransferase n=1 Tax=Nitrobacter sp. TaxID=29420 RepID=UPI00068379D2|nr:site-specific DNA-methyltransferase [Nitrobacter sp.]MCV0387578.1 site-specific DNA-methyltransferase [Nitrobacter sp.]
MKSLPSSVPSAASTGKWPADRIERWPIERLIPYARNARTHSNAQIDQIAASIREWGWTNPVLVGEDGTIIAGHGRVLGARKLRLSDVPVMVAAGWSDAQKRAYAIADNKLSLNAGWDEEILGLELGELEVLGFDLDLIGFSEAERIALLAQGTEGLTDPDEVPEPPKEPVTRSGDVWLLGRHRLLCGDSTIATDVEKVLAGVKPHLMVTDPPYGVNYDPAWRIRAGVNLNERKLGKVANDDRADWREAWALFPGTVAYVWHAGRYTSEVQQSLEAAGFEVRAQIIWAKDRFALSRGHYHWQHEPCWYAVRGTSSSHWSGDRKQSTLWTINAREDGGHGHGTQKPVECMRRPIENNSSPGQAIYEPFSGSGTTIIAAEMTGRSCSAIELDPAYVDVAVLRWQAFTGQAATLEGDGRPFINVAGERRPEKAS